MRTTLADLRFSRCPSEATIELWAMRDVARRSKIERRHLRHCDTCREIYGRFVEFYRPADVPATGAITSNRRKVIEAPGDGRIGFQPEFRTMRPFGVDKALKGDGRPVSLFLSSKGGGAFEDIPRNPFISSDGVVIGEFLSSGDPPEWSFHLLSPEQRFVCRALVNLPQCGGYFQSDENGNVKLYPGHKEPRDIESIEVVASLGEAAYVPNHRGGMGFLPGTVELEVGALGRLFIEEEESDSGESVLHVMLGVISTKYPDHSLLVALSPGIRAPLIEETVGSDAYFYGPDLLHDFRIWVYIR
jgi:hypothetical protein